MSRYPVLALSLVFLALYAVLWWMGSLEGKAFLASGRTEAFSVAVAPPLLRGGLAMALWLTLVLAAAARRWWLAGPVLVALFAFCLSCRVVGVYFDRGVVAGWLMVPTSGFDLRGPEENIGAHRDHCTSVATRWAVTVKCEEGARTVFTGPFLETRVLRMTR